MSKKRHGKSYKIQAQVKYWEQLIFKSAIFRLIYLITKIIILISSIEMPTSIFFRNYGRHSRVTFGKTAMTAAAHFAIHQSSLLTSLLLTVALHYQLMTFES